MGLCGSFRCGCGLTSTPATEGAINGELPTIFVAGSGEPGDPFDLTLNDAWAEEVAGQLNNLAGHLNNLPPLIQWGTVTTAAGGATAVQAVVWPEPFGATPVVLASVMGSASGYIVETGSESTTGTNVIVRRIDGANVIVRTVAWIAIGTPA